MRILMLAQSYAPIMGGEERVVQALSEQLAVRGHEVAVATLRQPGVEPAAAYSGVRIHPLRSSFYRAGRMYTDHERRHAPPGPDPETVFDLRRVIDRERPEIVHAHNWLVYSFLPLRRRSHAALVMSLHDYSLVCATKRLFRDGAQCAGPGPLKCVRCATHHYESAKGAAVALGVRALGPVLRRQVDVFLPISSTVRDLLQLSETDNHFVVPDFLAGAPARVTEDNRLARLPDAPFILYFGDIFEDKGALALADAHAGIDGAPPLVMIGRCGIEELRDRSNVILLGPWPHPLVMEALHRSLFSVAPSIWPEPFGLVALETAAMGKPLIASDIGGLRDIVVDGETGLLVAPGDRQGLRGAIRRLLAGEALRDRLGAAALERAQAFSADAVVPRFEEAYRNALATRVGAHG